MPKAVVREYSIVKNEWSAGYPRGLRVGGVVGESMQSEI